MISYSYYPFLPRARREIKEFDKESILFASENIEKYSPSNNLNIDIPVWLISTIILRNLNNNFLTKKFIGNYTKLAESHFLKDIENKTVRKELFEYFDIKGDISFFNLSSRTDTFIKIHVTDYLSLETLTSEKHFKLVNQVLEKGDVIIEKKRFVYLMRLVLEKKLFEKIKGMKEYKDNETINKVVDELRGKYPEYNKLHAPSKENIPDSIKILIYKIHIEHYLDHRSRIKLGIFLQKYNFDWEYIIDLFKELSDYDPKITEYQLKSLRKYIQ